MPTAEEYAARLAEIQAGWTEEQERARRTGICRCDVEPYTIPEVHDTLDEHAWRLHKADRGEYEESD